jgi:hypothetical protein
MDLPNNEIGISDILAWRDCPRRMSFSMRRWTDRGEPPEATNESNAYGSAIHMVFDLIEREGLTDSEAIQRAFDRYGGHLWPHDLLRMRRDVDTYHERDPSGVRLIGSEINVRVPLFKWGNGEQIWFRGQIDRLYERVNSPGRFIHRDYKSSKWPKTQEEIDEDLQMWSYNWLIHEFWPECEDLEQVYDQLLEGELRPAPPPDQGLADPAVHGDFERRQLAGRRPPRAEVQRLVPLLPDQGILLRSPGAFGLRPRPG